MLLIKRLRIQPSLLAPSRLGRFAKRLFAGYLIDVLSLNSGRGGNPSFSLNGYVPLIQGQIQFLESSAGYATILGLHPQIGKFESPFNDNNNSTLFRYFQ